MAGWGDGRAIWSNVKAGSLSWDGDLIDGVVRQTTIAAQVTRSRDAAHVTLSGLAEAAGISTERLTEIERGSDVNTLELNAIARATGRTVDYFLQGDDEAFEVLMRAGDASGDDAVAAVDTLARFVRDYEFLISLPG